MKLYKYFYFLTFLNFFTLFSADPQFNEFSGEFIYDFDVKLNELYILNEKLELSTYELSTNSLKGVSKIKILNDFKTDNINWDYIIKNQLIDINKNVGFSDLKLIKFNHNGLKLVHKGGGLMFDINEGVLKREDNSFAFTNKFHGDYFEFQSEIFHFGGYGLFRSNNTLLKFDKGNSNQWDEITYQNILPNEISKGIVSFSTILVGNEYYIIGGNSNFNRVNKFNTSILKFNLDSYEWKKIGEINLDLSNNPLIITDNDSYYIFEKDNLYVATIGNYELSKYDYNFNFNPALLGNSIQMRDKPMTFITEFSKGDEFSDTFNDNISNKTVYTFKPHNSKYETKILQKYNLSEIIDITSKTEFPLLKNEQSRNQFFIPLLILISIIILNIIYKALRKSEKIKKIELYRFENNELYFNENKIEIDNNAILILNVLSKSENITSNDIVSALVKNGLSFDYASKIKNKVIESLNDKFNFLTSAEEPFIKLSKSKIDKRIQVLNLLKK
jgi:hypothetical protein